MEKCCTLLLLSALLVSSMSAPTPPDTGDTEIQTTENNTIAGISTPPPKVTGPNSPPEGQSHSGEIGQLIHKFARIFDMMTLSDLKLLEKTIGDKKDLSEFEGLLGVLADDGKDGGEDVDSMLDQLKGHYTLLHGILRGKISRKEKPNPVSNSPGTKEPSKEPPSQSNGQSSSQNRVKPKLDASVEKIVEQQLLAAVKILPIDDLEKLQSMLAEGNDPSQTLKGLQPAFPKLTDDLIKVVVKYPSELKAVIEQFLFENELESVTPATTTVEPSKPNQTDIPRSDDERNEDGDFNNLVPGMEVDEHDNQDTNYKNHNDEDQHRDEEWSLEKTVLVNSKNTKSQNEPKSGGWFGAWHFLIIFLVIAALVGVGYYCSHNRKKIRAGVGSYISDASSKGRRSRNYRYKPVSST